MAGTVKQHYIIDMSSNNNFVQVPAVQGDGNTVRYIEIELISNGTTYEIDPDRFEVTIIGTKPDGTNFWNNCTIENNYILVELTYQMLACAGRVDCQIMFFDNGRNDQIKSFPFYLVVTQAAYDPNKILSSNEFANLVEYTDGAVDAYEKVKVIEEEIVQFNSDAEAWAVGKRDGQDVPVGDETYHNNSKYYSGLAGTSATTAVEKAEIAVDAADRAEAWSSHPPYIGDNGNWWVYNITDETFVDSGIDASITLQIQDITMLDPSATPYVLNSGTNTDAVFHLYIPRGIGISRIRKTATVGLVDTYTITYSDGSTMNYSVTNGKSAYQSAVDGGYEKTEQEFYNELASFGGWYEDAVEAAENAEASATSAESWNQGGTDTRPGEDTDNAKYWAAQAQASSMVSYDEAPTKDSLNPVRSRGIYDAIGKRITGVVHGDTLELQDDEITNDSVIEGPYIEDKYMRIADFVQNGTTLTFTFNDLTGDGKNAIAWIRS